MGKGDELMMGNRLMAVLLIVIGLLFIVGGKLLFGFEYLYWENNVVFEEQHLISLPIPQSKTAGWIFIGVAFAWLVPGWVVARTSRFFKKYFQSNMAGRRLLNRVGKGNYSPGQH